MNIRFWKNFDWLLLGIVVLLISIGLIIIYSTSFKAGFVSGYNDVRGQIVFAVIGLILLIFVAQIDYRVLSKPTGWMYLASILLLLTVRLVGKTALGGQRWINLGFFQLQPSEITKIVLIIVLAKFFSKNYEVMDKLPYILQSMGFMLLPFVLVLSQPDLGTAMVLACVWLIMILATGKIKIKHIVLGLVALAIITPLVSQGLKPYQKARLVTFLNPTANPLSSGYNVVQSTIAVGSGQWFGRGLASGTQSQLNFLPSQHTDFIFAVLAEKLGMVGAGLLLCLFGALLLRSLVIAWRSRDRFGMFLSLGIVAMLGFHMLINVGMNLGIMPVTGIPLPFISYGGTSMVVGLVAIGVLESIAARRNKIEFGA